MTIPASILQQLDLADPSWRPHLLRGLEAVAAADPAYLPALADDDYLPTEGRLFAAFAQPLDRVRYVLVGEGPYPRAASATGVCFMDGAVGELWSEAGLSKPVNRATSLRNFMKMLLVADGQLQAGRYRRRGNGAGGGSGRVERFDPDPGAVAGQPDGAGFSLLNAALVFRKHVAPVIDARAWLPFLQTVLAVLGRTRGSRRRWFCGERLLSS